MDAARRSYWRSYGGAPGVVFLLETFMPELRAAGLSDELLSRVLLATPASTYAFARAA
jgi:phosphotriesterase-related protein